MKRRLLTPLLLLGLSPLLLFRVLVSYPDPDASLVNVSRPHALAAPDHNPPNITAQLPSAGITHTVSLPCVLKGFDLCAISRVSVTTGGAQGLMDSSAPFISEDGRYVAFHSLADNLVSGDSNGTYDVFVHDRQTGETTLVSVDSTGMQGTSYSWFPSLSADGQLVAFESNASLVGADTNGVEDIYVHDRQTGQTTRVSVASDGSEAGTPSYFGPISADGRYVTFFSADSGLVTGDTNAVWDVFVHDRQTGQTTRVSVASDGTEANGRSRQISVSADGRFVAFISAADNLVNGDNNSVEDVFVHDRLTGETTRVSVSSNNLEGNDTSWKPYLSADGRYVAFHSCASNLVSIDANGNEPDIFIHDRQTGETSLISVDSMGTQGNQASTEAAVSADGRYVSFASLADNLVEDDTNGSSDVFVHDRITGETTRASVSAMQIQADGASNTAMISADGGFVAFVSQATNFVGGDTNAASDVFVTSCNW